MRGFFKGAKWHLNRGFLNLATAKTRANNDKTEKPTNYIYPWMLWMQTDTQRRGYN